MCALFQIILVMSFAPGSCALEKKNEVTPSKILKFTKNLRNLPAGRKLVQKRQRAARVSHKWQVGTSLVFGSLWS